MQSTLLVGTINEDKEHGVSRGV